MSCNTNEKTTDLPSSINLHTPMEPLTEEDDILRELSCEADDDDAGESAESDLGSIEVHSDGTIEVDTSPNDSRPIIHPIPRLSITMPSNSVVEISQTFYWPLYTKPIDWIFQEYPEFSDPGQQTANSTYVLKVAKELDSLDFFQKTVSTVSNSTNDESDNTITTIELNEDVRIERIISELVDTKEDWFSNLSGGQKSKVELVRKVFLRNSCPSVLLVDETMAPLDPQSKSLVMSKLKKFCSESIIIVIYHTDVGQGKDIDGSQTECVPSNDFFDYNLHLEHGILKIRETC